MGKIRQEQHANTANAYVQARTVMIIIPCTGSEIPNEKHGA